MKKQVVAAVLALAGTVVLSAAPHADAAGWRRPGGGGGSTPTPTTPPDCGTALAKADGSAWTCTFADNFDGTALNKTKWVVQTNFSSGTATTHPCYVDNGSTVTVADGALNLSLKKVATPVTCTFDGVSTKSDYVAGSVMTYRLFSQQYGRFEARIKNTATSTAGLHEAFWLWPDDRYSTGVWPYAGEIDVAETYSYAPTVSVPFLHYSADVYGAQPGVNTAWNCLASRGVWNTYTLEWSATRIEIFVNGKSCLINTSGDSAFKKPYIMALTQLMGMGKNAFSSSTPVPATMSVDYVRVWK